MRYKEQTESTHGAAGAHVKWEKKTWLNHALSCHSPLYSRSWIGRNNQESTRSLSNKCSLQYWCKSFVLDWLPSLSFLFLFFCNDVFSAGLGPFSVRRLESDSSLLPLLLQRPILRSCAYGKEEFVFKLSGDRVVHFGYASARNWLSRGQCRKSLVLN